MSETRRGYFSITNLLLNLNFANHRTKLPLFQQLIDLWLALMTIGDVTVNIAIKKACFVLERLNYYNNKVCLSDLTPCTQTGVLRIYCALKVAQTSFNT